MLQQLAIGMVITLGVVLALVGLVAFFRGLSGGDAHGAWGSLQLSLPGAIFVIALGAGMVGFGAYLTQSDSARTTSSRRPADPVSTSVPVSTPAATNTSGETPPGKVVITAPDERAKISGSKGTVMEGTAQNLGSDSLWIMTKSGSAKGGQVYYLSSDALAEVDGLWSAKVSGLGAGKSDIGEIFTLVVVRADSNCADAIENQKPNSDGDTVFERLPQGCTEAGTRHVLKTSA